MRTARRDTAAYRDGPSVRLRSALSHFLRGSAVVPRCGTMADRGEMSGRFSSNALPRWPGAATPIRIKSPKGVLERINCSLTSDWENIPRSPLHVHPRPLALHPSPLARLWRGKCQGVAAAMLYRDDWVKAPPCQSDSDTGSKGSTRTLPSTLRERKCAKASAVWSSGKTVSITGFNFPAAAHSSAIRMSARLRP
jgi:hypothetical protein